MTAHAPGLPSFRHLGVVLDYRDLRYNPCDDVIVPAVVNAGDRLRDPLGRWYMYYAPHDPPGGICLAYADALEGPWREHPDNPAIAREWSPHHTVSHVSAPETVWSEEEQKLFLYYHGENNTTRLATSADGIHFGYDCVAITTDMWPGSIEASYARVFRCAIPGKDNRYVATVMGNLGGTRHVFLASSQDGRIWEPRPEPLLSPPPGTNQVAMAWLLPWQGKFCLVYHAHQTTDFSIVDLHVSAVDPALERTEYLGIFHSHTTAGSDNVCQSAPCFVEDDGKLYLFSNIGPRLHNKIALAVAENLQG
jgi:hypothetical protein